MNRPEDYESWEQLVRPTFLAIAAAGSPFICWVVAREYRLPEREGMAQYVFFSLSILYCSGVVIVFFEDEPLLSTVIAYSVVNAVYCVCFASYYYCTRRRIVDPLLG